ncbi:MAG TPA: aldehyde dehydrogenase family protein, partial [Acidimicrobiia bacterium]|nr:aldehyde dehydrogenase family protein [Acidimicrobiia bacterium]
PPIPSGSMTLATSDAAIDQSLEVLSGHKDEWATLAIGERIRLLDDLIRRTDLAASRWAAAGAGAKGLSRGQMGEEWLMGPYGLLRAATALRSSLQRIAKGINTYDDRWVRQGADGRAIVKVLPVEWFEPVLLSGFRIDVWMEPLVTPNNLAEHTASFYKTPSPVGRVCGILGAGNVSSIPALDALSKLYVEGQVAAVKFNPVNDYLGPIFEEIFGGFIQRGWIRFLYGGAETGARLVEHPLVDTVHITGSTATHDRIVFGRGSAGEDRRRFNSPLMNKPISSELGGVSPFIVIPGPWTEADLRFQAENFVTQKLVNGGFNCIAAQVMVLPEAWPLSERFVEHVHELMSAQPPRLAYYPGADERRQNVADRSGALTVGASPCTYVDGTDHTDDDPAYREEFFSAAFVTTRLPGNDAAAYLENAIDFANTRLDGTLGANLVIHPATRSEFGDGFEAALAKLHYGAIAVNTWTAFNFLQPRAPWGAFPGQSLDDVGSGIGLVHNALMFDRPEKTVATGPFRPVPRAWLVGEFHLSPRPPWFVTCPTGALTAERFTRFAADHSPSHLPGIFASALRG